MTNFIVSTILLVISIFVISLFPAGNEFLGSIVDSFNEKKTNVTEEYDRVKGEVEDIKATVTETKEKVEETVETANKAVKTVSSVLDKINNLLGRNEADEVTENTEEE